MRYVAKVYISLVLCLCVAANMLILESSAFAAISADDLLQEFNNNEIAANRSFKDQIVTVSGVIDKIDSGLFGSPYLTLRTKGLFSVQCFFEKNDMDALAQLRSGQSVTITGVCQGKFMNILIKSCRLR